MTQAVGSGRAHVNGKEEDKPLKMKRQRRENLHDETADEDCIDLVPHFKRYGNGVL